MNTMINLNAPKVTDLRKKIYNQMSDLIVRLYERWSCEKEYEDFADYEDVMKKTFNDLNLSELTFIKATKRPFGFKYLLCIDGKTVVLHLYAKNKNGYLQFETKICL